MKSRVREFIAFVLLSFFSIFTPNSSFSCTFFGYDLGLSNLRISYYEDESANLKGENSYLNTKFSAFVGKHGFSESLTGYVGFGLAYGGTLLESPHKNDKLFLFEVGSLLFKLLDVRYGISSASIDDDYQILTYSSAGVIFYKNKNAFLSLFYSKYESDNEQVDSIDEIGIKVIVTGWK